MSDDIILEAPKHQFNHLPYVVIDVDEPVWNVIVFICINLIALPIMEFLADLLVRKNASLKVIKHERILLSDSRLGILSLYSTYYGGYRNLMFMVLLGALVIIMETFAEFCSSSTELREKVYTDLWKMEAPGNHSYLFDEQRNANGPDQHVLSLQDERFESILHWTDCVFASELHLRKNETANRDDVDQVIRSHYVMANTSIMKLFLSADNATVACDYFSAKQSPIRVWLPAVRRQRGTYVTSASRFRQLRRRSSFIVNWTSRIRIGDALYSLYGFRNETPSFDNAVGNAFTCLQLFDDSECGLSCESVACAFYAFRNSRYTFGFGEGSVEQRRGEQSVTIRRWRMEAQGRTGKRRSKRDASEISYEEQSIRFVLRMHLEAYIWASNDEQVEIRRVETMSRYLLGIAGESHINGEVDHLSNKAIQSRPDGVRQVPTVTVLALIPLCLFILLVTLQLIQLRRLQLRIRQGKDVKHVSKGGAKVETSMQWFRADFLNTVKSLAIDAELKDISLRLGARGDKRKLTFLPELDSMSPPP